jgi:hypothetical protein
MSLVTKEIILNALKSAKSFDVKDVRREALLGFESKDTKREFKERCEELIVDKALIIDGGGVMRLVDGSSSPEKEVKEKKEKKEKKSKKEKREVMSDDEDEASSSNKRTKTSNDDDEQATVGEEADASAQQDTTNDEPASDPRDEGLE